MICASIDYEYAHWTKNFYVKIALLFMCPAIKIPRGKLLSPDFLASERFLENIGLEFHLSVLEHLLFSLHLQISNQEPVGMITSNF